jgi:hypothetical protein
MSWPRCEACTSRNKNVKGIRLQPVLRWKGTWRNYSTDIRQFKPNYFFNLFRRLILERQYHWFVIGSVLRKELYVGADNRTVAITAVWLGDPCCCGMSHSTYWYLGTDVSGQTFVPMFTWLQKKVPTRCTERSVTTSIHYVTSHKSEDRIYTSAYAWNHNLSLMIDETS